MTYGVGLVVGKGPGLPKVLMLLYCTCSLTDSSSYLSTSFHVLQRSRKLRRLVANPDRAASDG